MEHPPSSPMGNYSGQLGHRVRKSNSVLIEASEESKNWRSQIVTSNSDKMGLRYAPMAFTEHGITMLSSVLKSDRAAQVNIAIIRAFIKMREMLLNNEEMAAKLKEIEERMDTHEMNTIIIMDQLRSLRKPEKSNKRKIGFHGS